MLMATKETETIVRLRIYKNNESYKFITKL